MLFRSNDLAGNALGNATSGIVRGMDPLKALTTAGVTGGVAAIGQQIPGFDALSPAQQRTVNSVVAAKLLNKDPTQAVINEALSAGVAEAKSLVGSIGSGGATAMDDGTTAGIQDTINDIETRPQDDGTTSGIQDIIGGGTTGGGSLGNESDLPPTDTEEPQCAPGYHWNGSICVSDEDVEDTSTS